MRTTCPVRHSELVEVSDLTKTIDAAVLNILQKLAGDGIAEHLARDLAEIASASYYVRGVAEDALKKSKAAETEVVS